MVRPDFSPLHHKYAKPTAHRQRCNLAAPWMFCRFSCLRWLTTAWWRFVACRLARFHELPREQRRMQQKSTPYNGTQAAKSGLFQRGASLVTKATSVKWTRCCTSREPRSVSRSRRCLGTAPV